MGLHACVSEALGIICRENSAFISQIRLSEDCSQSLLVQLAQCFLNEHALLPDWSWLWHYKGNCCNMWAVNGHLSNVPPSNFSYLCMRPPLRRLFLISIYALSVQRIELGKILALTISTALAWHISHCIIEVMTKRWVNWAKFGLRDIHLTPQKV